MPVEESAIRTSDPFVGMLTTIQVGTPAEKGRKALSLRYCVKFAVSNSLQTCSTRRVVEYAILLCRRFAANLSRQVCHDKIMSRKIKLAANVHAISK
ncbi:hypothetical protein AVEN_76436-1, partial [Araneus ventricosus]